MALHPRVPITHRLGEEHHPNYPTDPLILIRLSMNIGSGDAIDHDYVKLVEKVVSEEDFFGRAARNDRESRYPFENMAALKSVGVPSMAIHPQFGGPGHNIATRTKVAEAIAYGDPVSAACTNMHWGALDLIGPYAFGDENMAALLRDCAENQSMLCSAASAPPDELDVTKVGARFRRVTADGWAAAGRGSPPTPTAPPTWEPSPRWWTSTGNWWAGSSW